MHRHKHAVQQYYGIPVKHSFLRNHNVKSEHFCTVLGCCSPFFMFSSIHGLRHIITEPRHALERLLWVFTVSIAVFGTAYTSWSTWQRFLSNPTVIALERDYKHWNTSFPAMTLCPFNKTNDEAVLSLFDQRIYSMENKQELMEFLHLLVEANYRTIIEKAHGYNKIDAADYRSIILNISFILEFEAITSNLQGFKYDLRVMTRTLSELGVCYTFNSKVLAHYSGIRSPQTLLFSNDSEHSLVTNPLDGDVFVQIINLNSGGTIYLHSDKEIPDINSKGDVAPSLHFKTVEVTAVNIYSTEEVASLGVTQRRCRYLFESPLLLSPIYSYNLCRMDCRMQLSYQVCHCIPHFYWIADYGKYKICDGRGMQCLAKNRERMLELRMNHGGNQDKCQCLPPCDDTNYLVDVDSVVSWFMGTNFKWGIIKYPRIRFKRDILFGISDLLVAIGGSAGLFLGCSLLSFIEIIYWVLLLLFQWFKNSMKKSCGSGPT